MRFSTKCYQLVAIALLYHCSVVEFEQIAIFRVWPLTTLYVPILLHI